MNGSISAEMNPDDFSSGFIEVNMLGAQNDSDLAAMSMSMRWDAASESVESRMYMKSGEDDVMSQSVDLNAEISPLAIFVDR